MFRPNTALFNSLVFACSIALTSAQEAPTLLQVGGATDKFSNPVLFAGSAGFFTGIHDGYTPTVIAQADGSTVTELVNLGTLHPSGTTQRLSGLYNLAGDADYLYFSANSSSLFSGSYGLFRHDGSTLEALVPDSGALPPQAGFTGISGVKAGGGKVVFHVRQIVQNYEGYFLHDGTNVTLIADTNTSVAEGSGSLLELPTVGASISPNGEHIVLRVKTAEAERIGQPDGYTIYRFVDGGLTAIANLGDSIGGGFTIGNMPTQPLVLDDGSVLISIHTIPQGQALVVISPDNVASIVPLPPVSDGNRINLSGVSSAATDGVWVYGVLTISSPTYALIEQKAVRYKADGTFEDLFDLPFEANGETWSATNFQFCAATSQGFLAIAQNAGGDRRIFTNIESLYSSTGPAEGESIWSVYEDYYGWKYSTALGWVFDDFFPYAYSATLSGWIFITGSSLESYYFYNYADDSWYWTAESFAGWIYRFSGGGVDPEWVFVL